jgi:hypothetical protein
MLINFLTSGASVGLMLATGALVGFVLRRSIPNASVMHSLMVRSQLAATDVRVNNYKRTCDSFFKDCALPSSESESGS